MTDTNGSDGKSPMRKLAVAMVSGGVAGFVLITVIAKMTSLETFSGLSKSADVAILVGAFYILMALGVGFGALRPSMGSKILNVEDAEELIEQRSMLLSSSGSMALWGAALIILALGAPEGPLAAGAASIAAVAAMAIGSYFAWQSYRASDELVKSLNSEGTVIAFILTFLTIGGWAIAQHSGFARVMGPLDIITIFYVVTLAATFIAVGRRGLLTPR